MSGFREFFESVTKKALLLPAILRKKVNNDLSSSKFGTYFNSIPLKKIQDILKKHGLLMVQSDGTEWEGFISAGRGYHSEMIDIAFDKQNDDGTYNIINNSVLVLGWEKLDINNKIEITCYLS